MTKISAKKLSFNGGGFIIVDTQEDYDIQCAQEDFEGASTPTKSEIKEFNEHQAFMKLGVKYMDLIEEWVQDRPEATERFRYDANDILNLMSFLMKKKEPAVKKAAVGEISSEEFKKRLAIEPFGILDGGADA